MKASGDAVAQFDKATEARFKKIEDSVGKLGQGAGSGFKEYFTATAAVKALSEAFAVLKRTAIEYVTSAVQTVLSTVKLSDALNVSTESVVSLHTAARKLGIDGKDVDDSLTGLNQLLGQVDAGSLSAAQAFKLLGLNGAELSSLPLDQAFQRTADAIAGIQNPGQRAAAAYGVFGDKAAAILPLLAKGGESIGDAAKEAAQLGNIFSRDQGAQVEQAAASLEDVKAVLEGIGVQLAIQVAPWISAAIDAMKSFGGQGYSAGKTVSDILRVVAKAVAYAYAGFKGLEAVFIIVKTGFQAVIEGIVRGLAVVFEKLGGLTDSDFGKTLKNTGAGLREFANSVAPDIEKVGNQLHDIAFDIGGAIDGVDQFFDAINKGAAEAAAALAKVKKAGGAVAEVNKNAEAFKKGKQIFEETRNPLEKYNSKLKELSFLLEKGAIDWETYARAAGKATEDLASATQGSLSRAGALDEHSQAAQSVITQFQQEQAIQDKKADPQTRMALLLEQARDIAQRQLDTSLRLADYLQRNADQPARIF